MTTTELYAEIGQIYMQIENYQNALQQLVQLKQQKLQELQQAIEAESKPPEETNANID